MDGAGGGVSATAGGGGGASSVLTDSVSTGCAGAISGSATGTGAADGFPFTVTDSLKSGASGSSGFFFSFFGLVPIMFWACACLRNLSARLLSMVLEWLFTG
jgi:hypothetical protein